MNRKTVVWHALVVLGLWTLFGLLSSGHFFMRNEAASGGASFGDFAGNILPFYWAWAALTPAVLVLLRRSSKGEWRGWIELALGIPVLVLVHGALYLATIRVFGIEPTAGISAAQLRDYVARHGGGDLATIGMVAGLYLLMDANRRAREREVAAALLETRLARADVEVLRWQLHPHFLFNALNTVSTLVLRGDTSGADDAIGRIARYLRSALAQRADATVSLDDELTVLRQYVAIETLRFGDNLTVDVQVTDDALCARIPGLILQPLVENAIRYGAGRNDEGVPIVVAGWADGARLHLTVTDSGGRPDAVSSTQPASNGFGLSYVRQRLSQFYGTNASLSLAFASAETTATLDLPFVTHGGQA